MVNNSWKSVMLSQIGTFQKGSGISRAESNSGVLPAVRYGELYTVHNNYVRTYTSHISREVANKALRVHYGDVLFACSGETKEDIAKCAAIIDNSEVYAGGDIIVLSPTTEVDPIFLGFILNTPNVIQQRAQKAQGDAIVHISADSIKSIEITVPEYTEQVKIAKVLYDIDTLIVNLEKLIAKKKAIKQGAIQELLTGKRRLPGFNGEWKSVKLGDYCTVLRGGSPRPIQAYLTSSSQGANWIKIGDVREGDKYITSTAERIIEAGICKSREVFVGDFILSNSMSFGRPYILKIDGCIHDGWLVIQNYQESFDQQYLYYVLGSDFVKAQYIAMAAGSSVQNLNKEKVSNVTLYKPDIEEQQNIASILSNMDEEISGYEAKLAKYIGIKQGMMSELLTGRIRLV